MKKHILAMSIAASLSITNVSADTHGFANGEDLGRTLGAAVDDVFKGAQDAVLYIFELPEDTKKWTVGQVAELKDKICEKPQTIVEIKEVPVEKIVEVIKEVPVETIVEKIVYVDREVIKKVYIEPKERHCTTKRQSDRFGNVEEDIKCTEWKQ
jgi:hypothetical protein